MGNLETFEKIASILNGFTSRAIISLVDVYKKTERRLKEVEKETCDAISRDPHAHPELERLTRGMAEIAARNKMEIQSCAEDPRLEKLGIRAGKCVDNELINRLFDKNVPV